MLFPKYVLEDLSIGRGSIIRKDNIEEFFNHVGKHNTNKEEIKVPIPFKLVGMHEDLEKNFDWIVPENPFDESSEPKSVHRGSFKTHLDIIQFLVEKTSAIDLDAPSFKNT
jgi:hypothetical protein